MSIATAARPWFCWIIVCDRAAFAFIYSAIERAGLSTFDRDKLIARSSSGG